MEVLGARSNFGMYILLGDMLPADSTLGTATPSEMTRSTPLHKASAQYINLVLCILAFKPTFFSLLHHELAVVRCSSHVLPYPCRIERAHVQLLGLKE